MPDMKYELQKESPPQIKIKNKKIIFPGNFPVDENVKRPAAELW